MDDLDYEGINLSDEDEAPMLINVPFDNDNKTVPITILTGFLGSGKTTLLNYILTASHGKRIAVIENEFSAGLGIEGMIARSGVSGDSMTNFFELNNGCICCTVKDNLLITLEQLVLHRDRFDYILIEATGMANPGPIITSLWTDSAGGNYLYLDGVVCVVDTANIVTYLQSPEISNEVQQQLCYADRILLNKIDLISSSEQIEEIDNLIKTVNSFALVQRTVFGRIDLDFILSTDSYNSKSENPHTNGNENSSSLPPSSTSSFLQCFPCAPLDNLLNLSKAKWGKDKNHSISSSLTSSSLKFGGKLNLNKLKQALDQLMYTNNSPDEKEMAISSGSNLPAPRIKIYRIKGLLHIEGVNRLYILQAVHNTFDLQESEYEIDGEHDKTCGENLLIFIGYQLQSESLIKIFENCTN